MIVLIQALDSKLSLETAMGLYGLEHSELFWEKALDTKLLMAWNSNTIVMAFRGTASFANALADLQARPQNCTLFSMEPLGCFCPCVAGLLFSDNPSRNVAFEPLKGAFGCCRASCVHVDCCDRRFSILAVGLMRILVSKRLRGHSECAKRLYSLSCGAGAADPVVPVCHAVILRHMYPYPKLYYNNVA